MRMVESRSCVQREGVYRWFSSLTSAQRAEFLCGLLDLCVPIELRFLGSCLEDLARKDYHSLRDAEIKANNPVDLSGLTNITDEVVRSKLLVSLALLGSDNREAAGVLYRTLTHIDTVINNYGLALNDGRTAEQFLLLFTMASHHPAFSFHQKQVLRQQLSHVQDVFQVSSGGGGGEAPAACPAVDRSSVCYTQPHHHYPHQTMSLPLGCSMPEASAAFLPLSACQPCHTHCTCWHKNQTREACAVSGQGSIGRPDQALSQELTPHPPELPPPPPPPSPPTPPPRSHLPPPLPAGQDQDAPAPTMNHQGKAGKVVIERVVLRGVTHKSEDGSEYVFEANWSDGLVSSIVRTRQEVTELLSQLSQAFPDRVEKFLPQSVELDARCLTALPCHVLHHHSVQLFFTSALPVSPSSPVSTPPSLHPSPSSLPTAPVAPTCPFNSTSNLGCTVQYRGTNRAVYRVASVQPVVSSHSSVLARPSPLVSSLPPPPLPPPQLSSLPPSMVTGGDAYSQPQLYPQALHLSHAQPTSHSLSQSLSYSPSHSHSRPQSHLQTAAQCQPNTLEQNGILDWLRKLRLHKYYPVFKQLTMEEFLALSEDDLNKYDLTQGAKKKLKTQLELQKSLDREMKMEKRPCSGIARVTPSSHMGPSTHPTSSSTGELRVEVEGVPHHQPVPTDSSSSSGYSSSSCSPRAPPLCGDSTFDRARDMHRRVSGPDAVAVGLEKERPCLFILNSSCSSRPTAQVLPVQTDPGPPPLPLPQSAYHTQACYPQSLLSNPARIMTSPRKPRPPPLCTDDRAKLPVGSGFSTRAAVGLMVETSSALTSTSNSLHHVSHPPLHFHLSSSSSSSPSPSGYYSCPPISSSSTSPSSFSSGSAGAFASMATSSSVPVIAVPGTSYYPAQPSSSPSSSPSAVSPLDQSSAPSMCVCSSCGCRGNCGVYGALPGYAAAGYLQQFSAGTSLFTLAPLLLASGPSSYPMMVPPQLYQQGHAFYQAHGMLGNVGQKRAAGYLSCYNCGANGHRAEECKQPAMDSAQQGTFRLKYTPHSDSKDSGD